MNGGRKQVIMAGRVLLDLNLQNTHSGNISLRRGSRIFITRSGSRKGHLKAADVIGFEITKPVDQVPGLSSEAGTHRGVLEYSQAVIHCHSIAATLISFLSDMIIPTDWLGRHYLQKIPVLTFEKPAGSDEMAREIPKILRDYPAMVVRTHGPFVRGSSLSEALRLISILDRSAEILLYLRILGIDPYRIDELSLLNLPVVDDLKSWSVVPEKSITGTMAELSDDLFQHRLTPLFTGSVSVKSGNSMVGLFKAALPSYMGAEYSRIPIDSDINDYFIRLHQHAYRRSKARSVIFTHSPFGIIQSIISLARGLDHISPDDAEGRILYPLIPVIDPREPFDTIIAQAERRKVVILAGLGALSLGETHDQVIHHCSSLRNICKIKTGLEIVDRPL